MLPRSLGAIVDKAIPQDPAYLWMEGLTNGFAGDREQQLSADFIARHYQNP